MSKKKKTPKAGANPINLHGQVLELFRMTPDKRYSVKSLSSTLGITARDQRDELHKIVQNLLGNGVIEETARGKYRLTRSHLPTYEGIVDMTKSGDLYVVVEELDRDIHVSSRHRGHAMHGDRVRVAITRKRKGATNPEGEVVEVVERAAQNYVGVVERSGGYAFIRVDTRKIPNDIFIPVQDLNGAQDGQKVVVKIIDWPETMKNPRGVVVDVLGKPGDNDTEMHAILAEYDLPYKYPQEVEQEADRISDEIPKGEINSRRDFRGVTTFTIDPDDAKDFDDALSMQRLPNGNVEVGVHIADVTYYVKPGGIIDAEGQERATSVYLVDRTIPMLPERLSNYLCSLRPNEEKLCFSAVFELNEEAQVLNQWFGRTIIYSDRRFTYKEAQDIIETGQGDYADEVLALNTLAQKMRKERFRNGSITFEREEAKFNLDENGKPLGVYFKEMKESNQLIEEFMLLANRRVAEFIGRTAKGQPERTFVYRIHDKPNTEKLDSLRNFVTRFGYHMKPDATGKALSKDINKLMDEIRGKEEENLISTLAIRSMAKAVYSTENIGHYGLAFSFYTHFTSPIRRYPDMMVHRLLAHYMAGGKSEDRDYYESQCEHSSAMEQRAAEAERASIKYKMAEFMLDKIGMEFDGTISGCTEWGIYVELSETHIEGMVSVRDMHDDHYAFDSERYAVVGRLSGRVYTLGDKVRIRVLRADLERKQVDFELVASYDFHTGKATPARDQQ